MLTLERPLIFLDLETTGLDRDNARIIDMAFHKVYSLDPGPSGVADVSTSTTLQFRLDPGIPIPADSTAVHGITDQDVIGCPYFGQVAGEILSFLSGCDIAGFNSTHYDVPVLYYHFQRAAILWEPGHLVDVGTLFKILEPRSLAAAVRFYTGQEHRDSHTALGDTLATLAVFRSQLSRYDLPKTVAEMARHSNYGNRTADISGKFYYDAEHVLRFNFGKYRDEPASAHADFLEWMLRVDFPADTCALISATLYQIQSEEESDDDDYELPW